MIIHKNHKGEVDHIDFELDIFDKDRFYEFLKRYSEKFMNDQFTKGLDFLAWGEKFGYSFERVILVSHEEGTAFCHVQRFKQVNLLSFVPVIYMFSEDIRTGSATFFDKGASTNGLMKINWLKDKEVSIYCENLTKEQELFVIWLVTQIEETWYFPKSFNYVDIERYRIEIPKFVFSKFYSLRGKIFNKFSNKISIAMKEFNQLIKENPSLDDDTLIMKTCLKFKVSEKLATDAVNIFTKQVVV